jgi:hypothetical protein
VVARCCCAWLMRLPPSLSLSRRLSLSPSRPLSRSGAHQDNPDRRGQRRAHHRHRSLLRFGSGAAWRCPFLLQTRPRLAPLPCAFAPQRFAARPALKVKRNGVWQTWTYREYHEDVLTAAKAMIHYGLEPYHSVGILGFNSPEWFIADLAAIFAGGFASGICASRAWPRRPVCHPCQRGGGAFSFDVVLGGGSRLRRHHQWTGGHSVRGGPFPQPGPGRGGPQAAGQDPSGASPRPLPHLRAFRRTGLTQKF